MLNELYSLSTALKSKGISTKEWHREYKPLPKVTAKAPCMRIWLARDGSICGIESISAEFAQLLRKYGNNQGPFPLSISFPFTASPIKNSFPGWNRLKKVLSPSILTKLNHGASMTIGKKVLSKKLIEACIIFPRPFRI
jgi:hypothetical protein